MKIVIQRVTNASVVINNSEQRKIDHGLVVLLGIVDEDSNDDIEYLCSKLLHLRIFRDELGVMNKSLKEINGELLLVSQFTLHASTKKGNRPSYLKAAKPAISLPLYHKFILQMNTTLGKTIVTGEFGAEMQLTLTNDGPVTIIIDSKNKEQ
jgi:D-aminoacyl-tRNA deacylase